MLTAKDDIESMTYLILKLCFGELSWEHLKGSRRNEAFLQEIWQHKTALFKNREEMQLPEEIIDLLGFVDSIDYHYLKGIFSRGLIKMGGDFEFDWIVMNVPRAS